MLAVLRNRRGKRVALCAAQRFSDVARVFFAGGGENVSRGLLTFAVGDKTFEGV